MTSKRWTRESISLGLLIFPFLGIWLFFWLVPLVLGIELSFQPSQIQNSGDWGVNFEDESRKTVSLEYVGFENYRRILQDSKFWKAIQNSSVYVGGSILIILPLSFLLSLCLMKIHKNI